MQFRAFSSDLVYELFQNSSELLDLEAVRTEIGTFPDDGMFVLQRLPGIIYQYLLCVPSDI